MSDAVRLQRGAFQTAPLHRLAWLFVVGLFTAEVAGVIFLNSDAARAVVVVAVLAPCLVAVAAGSRLAISTRVLRSHSNVLWGVLGAVVLGGYGALVGFLDENPTYFLVADVFHWYGELLLVAGLTAVMLYGMSSRQLMALVAFSGLFLAALALFVSVSGSLGFSVAGGHVIRNLHLWRLEAGRGFPIVPLVLVTAILCKGRPQGMLKVLAILALAALFLTLIFTFKRAQWLTYAATAAWLITPQRRQWLAVLVGSILLAFAAVTLLFLPQTGVGDVTDEALKRLTYNPNFDTSESLDVRAMQLTTVTPYVQDQPLGHGFGATIYAYTPRHGRQMETHYIHNVYVFFAVQLGLPGLFAVLLLFGLLILALWRRCGLDADWDWVIHGCLGGIVSLSIMGLTIVSFHTVFLGFCCGLGALAIARVRLPRRSAVSARPLARRKLPMSRISP